jgi:hypothetical protein
MSWKTGRTNIELDFSDMSGGVANAYPAHSIASNQVADAYNIICENRGASRSPGLAGISEAALFDKPIRGWFIKKKKDGTEIFIAVSNKKIYNVNISLGTKTQIGNDITSDTECFATNAYGTFWLVNGVDFVKIEDDLSVYRVGIVAPIGFTASATGIGTLPAGTYGVAVSYTRKVSGTAVLHSFPQVIYTSAIPITMSGANLLRIVATASSDPQVTHITVWLTDAGGSVYYYYGESSNVSGNIDISSSSNRNLDLVMYEKAAGNQLPSGITRIYSFDGRLWGLKANDNKIYYTKKSQNVYDLEIWSTEFYIPTIPTTVISLHCVGADLFPNTSLGMYKIQNFDTSSKPIPVTNGANNFGQMLYFIEYAAQSAIEYNGVVYGLTNDGYRYFDGQAFSIDFSQHVKPWFDEILLNISNFPVCSTIYRRSGKRTELQISYNNTEVSSGNHNQTLVLNIDRIVISDNQNYSAPWEKWGNGYAHSVVSKNGILYVAQSTLSQGVIAQQGGSSDVNVISEAGSFVSRTTIKRAFIRTRTSVTALLGNDVWKMIFWMTKLQGQAFGKVIIGDQDYRESSVIMTRDGIANQPILDDPNNPIVFPFVLPKDTIKTQFQGLKDNTSGNSVCLEIEQLSDDPTFFIYAIQLYGYHEIESIAQ